MTWRSFRLNEIADLCLGKMLDKNKNKGSLRPYLANINVRWGRVNLQDLREMRFEDRELERYGLRSGDIVMCEGGEPGRCLIWNDQVPGMMIQKALHRIRPTGEVDGQFLYYALFHKGRSGGLDQYFTGATIKHLPGEQLAKVEVLLPPLETQRCIASTLGAYDDLIEVNRQRIKVLEEMARGLFEEWFVRFRFPGHEEVSILDTPDGPLPEGWLAQSLGKLGNVITGKTPSKAVSDFFGGGIPFVKIPDLHSTVFVHSTNETLSDHGATSQTNKTIPAGALCVSCIGTIGVVSITAVPCQTNQQINSLIPLSTEWTEFLYFSLARAKPHLENLGANGATMGNVNKQKFSGVHVNCPPPKLLNIFHKSAAPVLMLIYNLEQANRTLEKSRDLLLPRLISGQLSVAEAEHQLEEVA